MRRTRGRIDPTRVRWVTDAAGRHPIVDDVEHALHEAVRTERTFREAGVSGRSCEAAGSRPQRDGTGARSHDEIWTESRLGGSSPAAIAARSFCQATSPIRT